MTGSRCSWARLLLAPLAIGIALLSCGQGDPKVFIDSHSHGDFVVEPDGMVTIRGRIRKPSHFTNIEINGVSVPLTENDFAVDVSLNFNAVFNRITLIADRTPGHPAGDQQKITFVIVAADGTNHDVALDGEYSPDGVGLRINDAGLSELAPVIESLSSGALDISSLIAGQNPIAQGSMSGISYTANVVEVGFGGFGMTMDPASGVLNGDIQIDDFFLEIDLELGFLGSCTLEIDTTAANILGGYDLGPLAEDPIYADVNLSTPISVVLQGFNSTFVSGICNDPLIGDIVNLIIGEGDIQQLMQDGFEQNLGDPDGAGPEDSVIAAAIQDALAGISIAGPVGTAVGGELDAPINSITEDADGVQISADAAIFATQPEPTAPDLPASYEVAGAAPVFGATTPVGGLPYGMAFAISTSAMNQLLKTQTENGLLADSIVEMFGQPITAGLLHTFFPLLGFGALPASTPIQIDIIPTMAPVMDGQSGPDGELTQMRIGGLGVELRELGAADALIAVEVETRVGVDLLFTSNGLEFTLGEPASTTITVFKTELNSNETAISQTFKRAFALFLPQLASAIDAFPLPAFLGLDFEPLEVSIIGTRYIGLFANLLLQPTTQIENVVFSDFSSGNFQESGGCWLREWRHRVSGAQLGNTVTSNARGMLGADAGCTTNDASTSATMSHRINFDVVSVPGEEWTLDIDHSILGALDRISDGYNDGFGFQDGGGSASISTVAGSYSVVDGASGVFDFVPVPTTSISDGWGGSSSNENVEFSGTNGVTLVGTGDASVQLDFSVGLSSFSDSRTAFPTCNGDEMAIRLGKNDTIDSNFTAGSYPGMGSRNIANDGHKVIVSLTSTPLP